MITCYLMARRGLWSFYFVPWSCRWESEVLEIVYGLSKVIGLIRDWGKIRIQMFGLSKLWALNHWRKKSALYLIISNRLLTCHFCRFSGWNMLAVSATFLVLRIWSHLRLSCYSNEKQNLDFWIYYYCIAFFKKMYLILERTKSLIHGSHFFLATQFLKLGCILFNAHLWNASLFFSQITNINTVVFILFP